MGTEITVETLLTDLLSDKDHETIIDLRAAIDYGMPAFGYQWAAKVWRTIVKVDGEIKSHVGIVQRDISGGGHIVNVGGISGVWTVLEARGQGLASTAITLASELIRDELHASFALLICRPQLEPFYQRLGWNRTAAPLAFDQPSGRIIWPLSVMVTSFTGSEWPRGSIDLRGLPW